MNTIRNDAYVVPQYMYSFKGLYSLLILHVASCVHHLSLLRLDLLSLSIYICNLQLYELVVYQLSIHYPNVSYTNEGPGFCVWSWH